MGLSPFDEARKQFDHDFDETKTAFGPGPPPKVMPGSGVGGARHAIDFHEGDKMMKKSFTALIRAAVALNTSIA